MQEEKAKLALKIAKFSKSLGVVKQDGKNEYSRYEYVSSEQMMSLLRDNLSKSGFSIIPSVLDVQEEQFQSKEGKIVVRTIIKMAFEVIDTETGFSITVPWAGADQDTGGKSYGQAVTEGLKRFLFKLLFISSSDKGEADPDSKTTTIDYGDKIPPPPGMKKGDMPLTGNQRKLLFAVYTEWYKSTNLPQDWFVGLMKKYIEKRLKKESTNDITRDEMDNLINEEKSKDNFLKYISDYKEELENPIPGDDQIPLE